MANILILVHQHMYIPCSLCTHPFYLVPCSRRRGKVSRCAAEQTLNVRIEYGVNAWSPYRQCVDHEWVADDASHDKTDGWDTVHQ